MRLKRRRFLALSGASLFGLAIVAIGKALDWVKGGTKATPGVSSSPESLTSADHPHTQTATAASQALVLRFVSVADTGTGDQGQYAVAQAMAEYQSQHPFALILLAGDNIYTNGEMSKIEAVFEQPYQAMLKRGSKFYACLGNHDIRTENGEPQIRYPGFHMQGRYYTFREQTVQFFALDTNPSAPWQAQLAWLERELSRSDAPWKIVFGHHPLYSSGYYGVNQALAKDLAPLFQKYRVQLYINGHDHDYERTKPINNTVYLTCGAGAGTRPVGHSQWTAHAASDISFAAFEVYDDRLEIRAINANNHVFDHGVMPLKPA